MHTTSPRRTSARVRSSPSAFDSERKRARTDRLSPDAIPRTKPADRSWKRDGYDSYRSPYGKNAYPQRPAYENGFQNNAQYQPRQPAQPQPPQPNTSKSRRLYIGNVPYHAGLTDIALTQFFSALYVAGFGPNKPAEPLPVLSFWLHADGKFGFMELRGEQEAVNMMQFNGVFLHNRPLRVNRPSDYRPEVHNPSGLNLTPQLVNIAAVMNLCEQLGGLAAAPVQLAAVAASQHLKQLQPPSFSPPKAEDALQVRKAADSPPPSSQNNLFPEQNHPLPEEPNQNNVEKTSNLAANATSDPTNATNADKLEYVVVSLQNLVTDEDLRGDDEDYEDLISDVQAECEKFASVVQVNIPRNGHWEGTAFIQFESSADAEKAVDGLRKRVFDNRRIAAVGLSNCKTATEAANRPRPGAASRD